MILKRLRVPAFGGLVNGELQLHRGLNVLEGPNEAGKSTLYMAIQRVLLTPSKLKKPQFAKVMQKYIPLGGDTARVELEFEVGGGTHRLKKSWGATEAVELRMLNGAVLTDDGAVSEAMSRLLPASEGTCSAVLMSSQGGIGDTLEDLTSEGSDALARLGDLLRKAFLETEGVSVDALRLRVQEEFDSFYGRWDSAGNRPEGGRGLENPWKQGARQVVLAYYAAEQAKKAYNGAAIYEETLDRLNHDLSGRNAAIAAMEEFVRLNATPVKDARERRSLIPEIGAHERDMTGMKATARDWPVAENKISEWESARPGLSSIISSLEKEEQEAKLFEQGRAVREKLKRVEDRRGDLARAEDELRNTKRVTAEDVRKIRGMVNNVEGFRQAVSAGKLSLTLTARSELHASVQTDIGPDQTATLRPGEVRKVDAGGRIRIEHKDWLIDVASGVGNVQNALAKLKESQDALSSLLKSVAAGSADEAEALSKRFERKELARNALRTDIERELGGETIETLTAQAAREGVPEPSRSLSVIAADLTNRRRDRDQKEKDFRDLRTRVKGFEERFGSLDDLNTLLGETSIALKRLQERLGQLFPLPAGFTDAAAFIAKVEQMEQDLLGARKDREHLTIEKATLEGRAPDQSAEELKTEWDAEQEVFAATVKKARAVARVKEVMGSLLLRVDTATYSGLQAEVARSIASLTENRYPAVAMKENMPSGLHTSDGRTIPLGLLSAGTKDILGLALRLAMAGYFLAGSDGFVMMDDPLVDLDPVRQERAARLLKEFSHDHQVLVFTCHPSHAAVLGGTRLGLK